MADLHAMVRVYRHIELANIFSEACRNAIGNGKASSAQIFASAAATQRRLALHALGTLRAEIAQ